MIRFRKLKRVKFIMFTLSSVLSFAKTSQAQVIKDARFGVTLNQVSKNSDFMDYFTTIEKEKNNNAARVQFVNLQASALEPAPIQDPTRFHKKAIQNSNQLGVFEFLENIPKGVLKNSVSKGCLPTSLEKRILNAKLSPQDFSNEVGKYFESCGEELGQANNTGLPGLLEFAMTTYHFPQASGVQTVEFVFEDGTLLKGYIAVQDDKVRPWVIVKCGVFCSMGESISVSNFMIHLYDQAPFNVIFLGNRTGVSHIKDNHSLTMGGFLESHDLFEVSRWLQTQSPYKDKVLELHALGISLGSSSALYASEFKDIYKATPNAPDRFFDSVAAICPVVNLGPTVHDFFSQSLKGEIFTQYTRSHINEVMPYLNNIGDIVTTMGEPTLETFPDFLGSIVARYGNLWGKNPFSKRKLPILTDANSLWKYNQFADEPHKNNSPLFLLASKDDMIVENKINTQDLQAKLKEKNNNQIGVANLEYGNHCALATAYGYPTVATIIRSYFLNKSPKYMAGLKKQTQKINFDFPKQTSTDSYHLKYTWEVEPKTDYANIRFEIFDKSMNYQCQFEESPLNSNEFCRMIAQRHIPFSDLKFLNIQKPQTEVDAQRLTRRLNYVLRVKSDGQDIEGTSLMPNQIEYQE